MNSEFIDTTITINQDFEVKSKKGQRNFLNLIANLLEITPGDIIRIATLEKTIKLSMRLNNEKAIKLKNLVEAKMLSKFNLTNIELNSVSERSFKAIIIGVENVDQPSFKFLVENCNSEIQVIGILKDYDLSLNSIRRNKPEVIFLEFNKLRSSEYVKKINKDEGYSPKIIFYSSSRENAIDAIRIGASGYLVTPINTINLTKTLRPILNVLKNQSIIVARLFSTKTSLDISSKSEFWFLKINDILRFEAYKNKTLIYVENSKNIFYISESIADIKSRLESFGKFKKIRNSVVVNLEFVKNYNSNRSITMVDGSNINLREE